MYQYNTLKKMIPMEQNFPSAAYKVRCLSDEIRAKVDYDPHKTCRSERRKKRKRQIIVSDVRKYFNEATELSFDNEQRKNTGRTDKSLMNLWIHVNRCVECR